jgi:hypothetical protein
VKADQWLSVRPGTDGAVALSIAGFMIEQAAGSINASGTGNSRPPRSDDVAHCYVAAVTWRFRCMGRGTKHPVLYDLCNVIQFASGQLACPVRSRSAGPDGRTASPLFDLFTTLCQNFSQTGRRSFRRDAKRSSERHTCFGITVPLPIIPGPGSNSIPMPHTPPGHTRSCMP